MVTDDFFEPNAAGESIFNLKRGSNSVTKYLIEFTGKTSERYDTIDQIPVKDYHNQFIEVKGRHNISDKYIIKTPEDLTTYYQKSAYYLANFSELFDWKKKCFPELLFTEDSFGEKHMAFGNSSPDFKRLYRQTVCCLSTLNNKSEELIPLDNNQRILRLQAALSDIQCSGKGSNENQKFKKKVFVMKDGQRCKYDISCTPHFKLVRGDTDYRIYFSWGDKKIKENAFIVVKVGEHWKNSTDSGLSEIKLD